MLLLLDSPSLRCDHLGKFYRPPYLRTMPSRKHAVDWVLALRDQLRISVSSAYRVSERRGKTKLDVRFQNGTRQYATLDIAWVPANSRKIQDSVEKIAGLVTGGRNVKEAYEALFGASIAVPEANESASALLIHAVSYTHLTLPTTPYV